MAKMDFLFVLMGRAAGDELNGKLLRFLSAYLPVTEDELRYGQTGSLSEQFSGELEALGDGQCRQNAELGGIEPEGALRRDDASVSFAEHRVQFS